jgi:quinol monooxygenase YgiN
MEVVMEKVTVINRFEIQPGKMEEFIEAQRRYVAALPPCGLVGGRMFKGADGRTAVLLSTFESAEARDAVLQSEGFKAHVKRLQPLVASASPAPFETAYGYGDVG